jgi:hypothetical protein
MICCNITYYNEPHYLKWWYDTIYRLNQRGYDIVLNIADDGSQRYPAEEFFNKNHPYPTMRLFRVKEDIGFNSHGCRNLLMQQTDTEWNLLSDIDRRYDDDTWESMYYLDGVKRGEYYAMASKSKYTLNEYFIHKDDFWLSGGYDEEFVNIHWGDRIFFETSLDPVCKRVPRDDWWCEYVRGARDVSDGPVATTQYPDDHTLINPNTGPWASKEGRERLKNFVRNRNATAEGRLNKPVIEFEWEQIF